MSSLWQTYRENSAFFWCRYSSNRAVMALCVLAGKRETEAGAARRMIGALVEPVEEVRQVFCGDAWPVIGDAELDAVGLLADGQSDVTAASGVAAGIDEQVAGIGASALSRRAVAG